MCESNLSEDLMSFEVLPHNGLDSLSSEYSLIPEEGAGSMLNTELDFSSQDLSMVEIQQKILELANDNAAMKDALERNNAMMKEQLNTISAWHGQITTSMSHQQLSLKESQEHCEQLLKENQELKQKIQETQVKTLVNDIATEVPSLNSKDNSVDDSVAKALINANETVADLKLKLDDQEATMLAQYQSAQDKIEKTEKQAKSLQQENSDLRFLIQERDREIESLKEQLSSKELEIMREQNSAQSESVNHAETKKLLINLQVKYDRMIKEQQEKLTSDWHKQSGDQQRLLVQVDGLTAQLLDMQDKLTEKEEQVVILTHQLEALNKDSEAIPVLKSQIEVFKLDLERARETKKTVEEEVQRLNQVVEDMQTRLNASAPPAEDVASHSSRGRKSGRGHKESKRHDNPLHWFHIPPIPLPDLSLKTIPKHGSKSGSEKCYECPICSAELSDPQDAQNHVNECLDRSQTQ